MLAHAIRHDRSTLGSVPVAVLTVICSLRTNFNFSLLCDYHSVRHMIQGDICRMALRVVVPTVTYARNPAKSLKSLKPLDRSFRAAASRTQPLHCLALYMRHAQAKGAGVWNYSSILASSQFRVTCRLKPICLQLQHDQRGQHTPHARMCTTSIAPSSGTACAAVSQHVCGAADASRLSQLRA